MKHVFKKILPLFAVIPMVVGCSSYHSDASEKSEMVGTYKLKTITKNHNKTEDPYDYKAEIGAEAYFTLDEKGYVYYAYKDNTHPLTMQRAFAKYVKDLDNENLYKAIEMTGVDESGQGIHKFEWEKEVGCMDEPTMGFRNTTRKSGFLNLKKTIERGFQYTIHYSESKWTNSYHEINYQYVYYEKISDQSTLGYLNNTVGTNYSFKKQFELQNCEGYYAFSTTISDENHYDNDVFEYAILDMEAVSNGNIPLYYSLKSEPGMKTGFATFRTEESESQFNKVIISVLGVEYECNNSVSIFNRFIRSVPVEGTDYYREEAFSHIADASLTIEQVISNMGK